ncbi:hypothetical protein PGT21_004673 [Puccinia graminis f. sp. tritici]|uniref:Uncharacterized protein n=1 Tax=Puccinia graminis f. sp. tritici TaxID=56615 RepID=A0A5B0MC39_PUCGR|nr:hypothetical protein PGTUg99_031686 [Puccinia graminis f. sp. tritici]KAA1090542.1 hypothetical protein PGT21_004673 [Puccinia graminis f. sp. tritici]
MNAALQAAWMQRAGSDWLPEDTVGGVALWFPRHERHITVMTSSLGWLSSSLKRRVCHDQSQ